MKKILAIVFLFAVNAHAVEQPAPCQQVADHLRSPSMASCPAGEDCIEFRIGVDSAEWLSSYCGTPGRLVTIPHGIDRDSLGLKGVRPDGTVVPLDVFFTVLPNVPYLNPEIVRFGYTMEYANIHEALLQFDHLRFSYRIGEEDHDERVVFTEVTYRPITDPRCEGVTCRRGEICSAGACACPEGQEWSICAEECVVSEVCEERPNVCDGTACVEGGSSAGGSSPAGGGNSPGGTGTGGGAGATGGASGDGCMQNITAQPSPWSSIWLGLLLLAIGFYRLRRQDRV